MDLINNYNFPKFITESRQEIYSKQEIYFECRCKKCKENPSKYNSLDELKEHMKNMNITFFTCPIPNCNKVIPTHSETITSHIKENHHKLADKYNLDEDGNQIVYCKECEKYSDSIHYHCFECKNNSKIIFFTKKNECDEHLKESHFKWWLENTCRYGLLCNGYLNGECSFNHNKYKKTYILKDSYDEDKICRYEKPWDKSRCKRIQCNYDHLWGRVRHVNKMRNIKHHESSSQCSDSCDHE